MDLLFLDNYEENNIRHDKFKKYFFLSYVDFFAICPGLARPLPIGLRIKYPVKTILAWEIFVSQYFYILLQTGEP